MGTPHRSMPASGLSRCPNGSASPPSGDFFPGPPTLDLPTPASGGRRESGSGPHPYAPGSKGLRGCLRGSGSSAWGGSQSNPSEGASKPSSFLSTSCYPPAWDSKRYKCGFDPLLPYSAAAALCCLCSRDSSAGSNRNPKGSYNTGNTSPKPKANT